MDEKWHGRISNENAFKKTSFRYKTLITFDDMCSFLTQRAAKELRVSVTKFAERRGPEIMLK